MSQLEKKSPLRRLANSVSHQIQRWPHLHALAKTAFLSLPRSVRGRQMIWDSLCDLQKREKDVFVLQVGANDGLHDDPIRHFIRRAGWRGLLVEPVPSIFEELRRNYSGQPGLIFENAAIADTDSHLPFYFIDDPNDELPSWTHEVGSFYRELVPNTVSGQDVTTFIKEISVPGVQVKTLIEKHRIRGINLVVVDAQGYDDRVILQIPFDRIKPQLIVYESCLLDEDRQSRCIALLQDQGYSIESDRWDTLAILNLETSNPSKA